MKIRFIPIILLLLLVFTFCSSDKNDEKKLLYLAYLKEMDIDINNESNVLIISKDMCHTCVQESLKSINNIKHKRNIAVFSSYSKKEIENSYGKFENIELISNRKNLLGNIKYQKINLPEPAFLKVKNNEITKTVLIPYDDLENTLEQLK